MNIIYRGVLPARRIIAGTGSGCSMTRSVTGLRKIYGTDSSSIAFGLLGIPSRNSDNCCDKPLSNTPYVFFTRADEYIAEILNIFVQKKEKK